jgi:hypothetical protein
VHGEVIHSACGKQGQYARILEPWVADALFLGLIDGA